MGRRSSREVESRGEPWRRTFRAAQRVAVSARRAVALALGAVTASVALGCTPAAVRLAEGPRDYVPADYEAVLSRWTRGHELILLNQLDNVLAADATFESWDFRWAFAVRYADDYRLTVDQRAAMLGQLLAETRRRHTFYVAFYADRYKWGQLDERVPAWTIRLIDSTGSEAAPEWLEEIDRPGAVDIVYFPYTTPWRRVFRVAFPVTAPSGKPVIAPDAEWVGLRFAGAQGNELLRWELGDGSE